MPGVSGRDLVEHIHTLYSRLPILVFSMRNEPKIAQGVLQVGASGYLTKECDQNTMVSAIRKVAAGGRYVEDSIVEQVLFDQVEQDKPESREHLSRRELQIMKMLAIGKTITEIGNELELSAKSVSTYKARVMKKMNFNSSAELVMYAVEYGLINKR
jgi:DNA-binding NarL/FixJ family response regulator